MVENRHIRFREAAPDDLGGVLDLYNYYILNSTAAFDYEEITLQELQARLSYGNGSYRTFLVCEPTDGEILGFCFLKQFRKKPAYDRTAEIGLYLRPEATGKKLGFSIVEFLEEYARSHEIAVIVATISGENLASIKLFEKMGYERCAHYKQVAIKFNRPMDLMNYEKIL